MAQVLRQLDPVSHASLLVGANTADDAGVFRIDRRRALVQTVDFFTPIVDDPFVYGEIAAANALSDVYAMGGRPLTALNIVAMPDEKVPPAVIAKILRGGAAKVKEAGCVLLGGHSIKNAEPIYGLSVTGLVNPARMLTNANARPGDLLVLTKPLGTGFITTGIKRGIASAAAARKAIHSMRTLNIAGAEVAEAGLVKAATDITGFGLLGHLASMCRASKVSAEIDAAALPAIGREVFNLIKKECIPGGTRANLENAARIVKCEHVTAAQMILAADAQTSGGLLLCVPPPRLERVRKILARRKALCGVIGKIVGERKPLIRVRGNAEGRSE